MRRTIAVDFDGTLCANAYPDIGEPNTALIEQLIEEQKNGTAVILFSCRGGRRLREAVKWSKAHGLKFDRVNENLPERTKIFKSNPRKISADLYIDDRAAVFEYGKKLRLKNEE